MYWLATKWQVLEIDRAVYKIGEYPFFESENYYQGPEKKKTWSI